MKAATLAALHTLQREHSIKVVPRLIAEWEYNRFFAPTVTVTPSQTGDDEWYQWYGNIGTVALPRRPHAGIAKARADDGMIPQGDFRDTPQATRYYPSYEYDIYMYWSSLQRSQLSQTAGSYQFDQPIVITSIYPQPIAMNKIVVGFELGYCKPVQTSIQITTDGTTWTTISTDPTINSDGTTTLWRGEFGWDIVPNYDWPVAITGVRLNVYSVDRPYAHLDVLQISPRLENDLSDYLIDYNTQFEVSSPSFIAPLGRASSNQATVTLSNIDSRFNGQNTQSLYYGMIEKKVKFTLDLGIDTTSQGGAGMEYIREFTMWTDSWGAGASAASTVQVQLKDSSVYLQEHNVPPMYLENFTVGGIVGQMMDRLGMTNYVYSKTEQELGQTIPFYWPSDTNEASNPRWGRFKVSTTLPPNTTVWEELALLAESTQTALFFDEHDQLQIVARNQMYNDGKPINWNLDAVPNGLKLPDVIKAASNYDLTTNQVDVTYKPCAMSKDANGFPIMNTVWQPTAPTTTDIIPDPNAATTNATDIVLRAAFMTKDLLTAGTDLWVSPAQALIWPWESDINIEGECLHYLGKEYGYYDANNVLRKTVVTSLTQQQGLDALNRNLYWKNAYTGRLVVTQRGIYGTVATDHMMSQSSYTALLTSMDNLVFSPLGDGYITQGEGFITQHNPITASSHQANGTYMLRKHSSAVLPVSPGDEVFVLNAPKFPNKIVWYGARIRFPSGYNSAPVDPSNPNDKPDMATATSNWHDGGLFFAGDWGDAGYFLDIVSTGQIDGWEGRKYRNEVSLTAMPGNAAAVQLKGTNYLDDSTATDSNGKAIPIGNLGFQAPIIEDNWYDIDVSYTERGSDGHTLIGVYINGVAAGTWDLVASSSDVALRPPANYTNQWRFGTHVRGVSMGMDIEYLYAVAEDETNPYLNPDQTSFLDLVRGDYASGFMVKFCKFNFQNINPSYQWPHGSKYYFPQPINQSHMILDEYGPVVHEIRTFDVQFDVNTTPAPASFLYVSNPLVECLSYESDAFGAEFMLANAARQTVVVNGQDDTGVGGAANTITQTLMVWGRSVYIAPNDVYLKKLDDDAIRKQGLVRTQFTSRYIQTDEMATDISNWILAQWATGVDQVQADLFGNPLLQIGDLVTMNYPTQGMAPSTHQYFVISVKGNYSGGYKTSVTLRRAKISYPVVVPTP